jgi:hypothetical protein
MQGPMRLHTAVERVERVERAVKWQGLRKALTVLLMSPSYGLYYGLLPAVLAAGGDRPLEYPTGPKALRRAGRGQVPRRIDG